MCATTRSGCRSDYSLSYLQARSQDCNCASLRGSAPLAAQYHARTDRGRAAWDRTPQHEQFPTSNYSLLRGNLYNVFLGPEHTESHMAQWIRRRSLRSPCLAFEPGHCFFLFFSRNSPLTCESSHEYSISIFIGRGFVRRGCMFSRNMFSRNMLTLASSRFGVFGQFVLIE